MDVSLVVQEERHAPGLCLTREGDPDHEVVVVQAVELAPEDRTAPGRGLEQAPLDRGQVAHVVGPQEREQVERGFVEESLDPIGRRVHPRLEGEDQVEVPVGDQVTRQDPQCAGMQETRALDDAEEFTTGRLEGMILRLARAPEVSRL